MKARTAVSLLSLVGCCFPVPAQTLAPTIKIGTLEITVGLPADQTIAALQRDYAVQPAQDIIEGPGKVVHEWLVSAEKNTEPIGVVYARANSVSGVEYMLKGRESDSAQDVFDTLFEAASKLSAEGHNKCALTTWSGYVAEASLTKAGISFDCGVYQLDLKRIQIDVQGEKSATGFELWESIGVANQ
jgi:hypothetical protein